MSQQNHITELDAVPSSADVVIIGGGLAGTAALWALERYEPGIRAVLLERSDALAAGSSLASLEAYRTCWTSTCLAEQMRRSVEVFHNADEYLGEGAAQSLALHENGYLFCGFTDRQAQTLKADVEHLHNLGISHIEYLDADAVRRRYPWLGERVIGAKYDPVAGWLDSSALVQRYAQLGRSSQIILGVQQTNICVEAGSVRGVETERGTIAAPKVLIAAGAGSRAIGRTAGVDLPIVAIPRQSFTTGWRHDAFPSNAPMVIGAAPFPHCHPEASTGMIFGWEYRWNSKWVEEKDRPGVHESLIEPINPVAQLKDARFPSMVLLLLARQFGHTDGKGFDALGYLRGIHHNIGYYMYRDGSAAYRLEDGVKRPYDSERAIIDAHPAVEGLYLSIAHGGHGIMTSPAAGEIAASRVLERDLPHPAFADFGLDVSWVEHDESVL